MPDNRATCAIRLRPNVSKDPSPDGGVNSKIQASRLIEVLPFEWILRTGGKVWSTWPHTVSDQGSQFQDEYRLWCDDNDIRPRFGAIGKSGSIAVLERFFRTLKTEMLRRLAIVPIRFSAMQSEVMAYMFWYNQHRPHRGLGGRTPAELRDGRVAAIDKPMMETRARLPLARGEPNCLTRRVHGTLELVVKRVEGRAHLPLVSLRQAA